MPSFSLTMTMDFVVTFAGNFVLFVTPHVGTWSKIFKCTKRWRVVWPGFAFELISHIHARVLRARQPLYYEAPFCHANVKNRIYIYTEIQLLKRHIYMYPQNAKALSNRMFLIFRRQFGTAQEIQERYDRTLEWPKQGTYFLIYVYHC